MEKINKNLQKNNTIWNFGKIALVFTGLMFWNFSSKRIIPNGNINKISSTNCQKVNNIKKHLIYLDNCQNIHDVLSILQNYKCIMKINPSDYFDNINNKPLLDKIWLKKKEDFLKLYHESDILRYAIYTITLQESQNTNINTLNNEYQKQFLTKDSSYTSYIYIPWDIWIPDIDKALQKIDSKKYFVIAPQKPNPKNNLSDIPKWKRYKQNWEIMLSWQEVKQTFEENNILVKSSDKLFDEVWDNKFCLRTCIHGMKLHTVDFLVRLCDDLKSKYGEDIMDYYPIVITWATENWHKDNPKSFADHPDWAKFDLSINWEKWIILAVYFAANGIFDFSFREKYIYGYDQKILPKVWAYAILAHPNKNNYGVHFDILVK